MDWKVFVSTFGALFLAELGDKTQLAVITRAATCERPWAVLSGAVVALALVSAIGVVIGQICAKCFPEDIMKMVAGGAFILMGILMLLGKL